MKEYFEEFEYCPKCGQKYSENDFNKDGYFFTCEKCGFKFFQNSKPATAVIIPNAKDKSEVLLTKRAINPHQGLLDTPGGFLNYGEESLEGAEREIEEELGIKIEIEKFLFTVNVDYTYQGFCNNVLVVFFLAKPLEFEPKDIDNKENIDCKFYNLSDIINHPEKMAFESDRKALKKYFESLK